MTPDWRDSCDAEGTELRLHRKVPRDPPHGKFSSMAKIIRRPESNVDPNTGVGPVPTAHTSKMLKSVVFIDPKLPSKYGQGTGCLVLLPDYRDQPMLLTCHHVIRSKEIAEQCTISFDREDDANPGTCVPGKSLFVLSSFTTNTDLDFTVIRLNQTFIPDVETREMFHLDKYAALRKESLLKEMDIITLVHYPLVNNALIRRQNAAHAYVDASASDFLFGHKAETSGGSSGCPVLREVDNRWVLVGMHQADGDLSEEGEKASLPMNIAISIEVIHKTLLNPEYKPQVPDHSKVRAAESTVKRAEPPMARVGDLDSPIIAEPPMARVVDLDSPIIDHPEHGTILQEFVVEKLAHKGQGLATYLGISYDAIKTEEKNYPRDACAVLNTLLNNRINAEPVLCWSKLIKAMEKAKCSAQARYLKEHLRQNTMK